MLLVACLALGLAGCWRSDPWDGCGWPDDDTNPHCVDDEPTTTTITETLTDCESTGGTCVREAPAGWFGPNLFTFGEGGVAPPSCASIGLEPGATFHADLGPLVHTCPTCDCGPSETTCEPSLTWTVAAAPCAGAENAPKTPFDVGDETWTGACNPDNPLSANTLCEGNVPCAQSVTVQPPVVTGALCVPHATGTEQKQGPPWPWQTVAQECLVTPSDTCTEGETCVHTPTDFVACISLHHGDHDSQISCLEHSDFYTEQHDLYEDVVDTRACSPCTCGEPEGGACAVQATVYADDACSDFMGGVVVFSGTADACVDLPAGTALGSKHAEVKLSTPGTCNPSGGAPTGTAAPARRVTLCCHAPVPE